MEAVKTEAKEPTLKDAVEAKRATFAAQLKQVNAQMEQGKAQMEAWARQKEQLIGALYALEAVLAPAQEKAAEAAPAAEAANG